MEKLNYRAAFNNFTSYSLVAVNILKELISLGVDPTIFPIGNNSPDLTDLINKYHYRLKMPEIYDTPSINIWHEFDLHLHVSRPYYGYSIFEINRFSENTITSIECCDFPITCSTWGKNVIVDQTKFAEEEVFVCPLGVDSTIFKPRTKTKYNKYIFINIG